MLLVDHQIGLLTGVRDIDVVELRHNVDALASAAKVLGVPTIVTTTAPREVWGPAMPELAAVVGQDSIIDRTTVNAWDDERIRQAVTATGASKPHHRRRLPRGVRHVSGHLGHRGGI